MGRYLEYDTESGRIISEIRSPKPPEMSEGKSLLEIAEHEKIEISRYAIHGGVLVKVHETNSERQERERLRREYSASAMRRVHSMKNELAAAILDDDEEAIARLKKEYKRLKVYM